VIREALMRVRESLRNGTRVRRLYAVGEGSEVLLPLQGRMRAWRWDQGLVSGANCLCLSVAAITVGPPLVISTVVPIPAAD
jgi:hypothetical protein